MNRFTQFLKEIHVNFWATLILIVGTILVILRHDDAGKMTIGGGLTMMQHKDS